MGAAAQLLRRADRQHTHLVGVLLAEQHHRARLLRRLQRHHLGLRGGVGEDLAVDDLLDLADLLGAHRRGVGEVEAGLVGIDQRALLLHVGAKHFPQRLVHQVGDRVVARGGGARGDVHPRDHALPDRQLAGAHHAVMAEHRGLDLLRVFHAEDAGGGAQLAAVADLAAGLGIERGVVEHDHTHLALEQLIDRSAVLVQREDVALLFQQRVAVEGGLGAVVFQVGGHLELAGGARLLLLARHRGIEGERVDGDLAFAADVGGEVEREAEGVVQLEGGVAVEDLLARCFHRGELGLDDRHAILNGGEEALFFLAQHVHDAALAVLQLGIGAAHLGDQVGHHLVEKRGARAELVAVADGAADDAAQHVAAALVARGHAVGDQEGAGADVVGQHLQRGRVHVGTAGFPRRRLDQRLEQVDLVVGVHMLQHRRDALQAHAGVHRGLGQRMHHALLVAVELHEHVVPDLDVAVAIFLGRSRRAAPDVVAVVVEDLGARAARAGVAHHPEVVRGVARALVVADADHALRRHADLLGPDVVGLVVLGVHRDPELVLGQLEDLGQQLPGVGDGVALEVVAEAEVAEHLEEGVVARGVADVLEVVVLAAGAHALLRGGGAGVGTLVEAEEHVLELVHAGVGEQQRRVLVRHERAGGHDLVALGFEELEEGVADFGGFHVRSWPGRC
ncbi:MAG: hypothetical protein BWZ09_00430 [Alphaproteobacteria bacterium ADurb.BinA305]|nr:MAG: hypothetical protein BWZ09_00430 [Alphaproteobacteria bacterium ADurb.BinA305]